MNKLKVLIFFFFTLQIFLLDSKLLSQIYITM